MSHPESQPIQQFNVINNQQTNLPQGEQARIADALRSTSQFITCISCGHSGLTAVERTTSCSNVFCCLCTSPVIWLIYQAYRVKDINCCDASHNCTKCGKSIGTYKAC